MEKAKFKTNEIVILNTSIEMLPYYKIKSLKYCSTLDDENEKKWHYELINKNGFKHSDIMIEEDFLSKVKHKTDIDKMFKF